MKSDAQIKKQQALSLIKLISFAGSQAKLARGLGVSRQVVRGWVSRGRISATMAIKAERETNGYVKREELRPDVGNWFFEE